MCQKRLSADTSFDTFYRECDCRTSVIFMTSGKTAQLRGLAAQKKEKEHSRATMFFLRKVIMLINYVNYFCSASFIMISFDLVTNLVMASADKGLLDNTARS